MTFCFVLFEKQIHGGTAVDAIHFGKLWMHSACSVLSPCMIAPSPYFIRIALIVPNHNTSHGGTASLEMELATVLSERSGFVWLLPAAIDAISVKSREMADSTAEITAVAFLSTT